MKLLIAVLVFNQLNDCKSALASIRYMTPDADWLIIDNGSNLETDNYKEWIEKYLRPPRLIYHRNDENVGVVKGLQQAYELAADYDIIAYLHNDVFIYEYNWHKRVIEYFKTLPNIGLVSFFGAKGVFQGGGRLDSTCNMIEAEIHCGGLRQQEPYIPIAICDGFSMICSKKMLDDVGGIDQDYELMHGYDRDLPLKSLDAGYNNICVNVPCHHISGVTACRPDYQEQANKLMADRKGDKSGDHYLHDHNTIEVFNRKWSNQLPIYITENYKFRTDYPFKNWRV